MPPLTDDAARRRAQGRARDMLWQDEAMAEVQDRLALVNKPLTDIAIVTDFPKIWRNFTHKGAAPAQIIPPDDTLGLNEGAFDLVIHAMALHWANDPVGQLVQMRRALRPDGLAIALMFGGQTLHELRSALAQAEAEVTGGLSPRVLPMGEIRDLGGLLQRAGYALPVADSYAKTLRYRDIYHVVADLRAFGEGNALAARARHFTRRAVFDRAAQIYAATYGGADGRIPATFEIVCLTGWAAHEGQQKPLKPGSAAYRLADALANAKTLRQKDG
ncbi:MAG: methyltransferase domain-containing protein [Cypionkella sp.]|nr:methyltransferase domain-containing protein [Cypionkella sp.]